jgi:hypothetical protein
LFAKRTDKEKNGDLLTGNRLHSAITDTGLKIIMIFDLLKCISETTGIACTGWTCTVFSRDEGMIADKIYFLVTDL